MSLISGMQRKMHNLKQHIIPGTKTNDAGTRTSVFAPGGTQTSPCLSRIFKYLQRALQAAEFSRIFIQLHPCFHAIPLLKCSSHINSSTHHRHGDDPA